MMKIGIDINVPDKLDLEHLLECVSDAMYFADCVTATEEIFIIDVIQAIKKQKEKNDNQN